MLDALTTIKALTDKLIDEQEWRLKQQEFWFVLIMDNRNGKREFDHLVSRVKALKYAQDTLKRLFPQPYEQINFDGSPASKAEWWERYGVTVLFQWTKPK